MLSKTYLLFKDKQIHVLKGEEADDYKFYHKLDDLVTFIGMMERIDGIKKPKYDSKGT